MLHSHAFDLLYLPNVTHAFDLLFVPNVIYAFELLYLLNHNVVRPFDMQKKQRIAKSEPARIEHADINRYFLQMQ